MSLVLMLKEQIKRNTDFECHAFKIQWSMEYFIIELHGKMLFSLYSELECIVSECSVNTIRLSTHHRISSSLKIIQN